MNHRDIHPESVRGREFAETRTNKAFPALFALCSLCLCGWINSARAEENWPLRYNEGVMAYQSNDFASAATGFERALGTKDRALQAKALYNLGNSCFRLGEVAEKQAPAQAMPRYEQSLKSYQNSLAVGPQDEDAKFNLGVVKKKIEELKKQQQQQQQQQNQQQQNQQQNQQQQKDQQQQNQQQQADNKQQQQSPKPEEKKTQQQPQQTPSQDQAQKTEPQPDQGNSFERAQARALLDNLRENEKNWNFFPELLVKTNQLTEPQKDW
jgi:Mg-chelatase subunit ChlI